MPVILREDPTFSNLRSNLQNIQGVILQKKLKDQEEKKKDQEEKKRLQETIQKAVLEAALKNQKLKAGADLSGLDFSQGIPGVLGKMSSYFEKDPIADLEERGKVADAENKIYQAGGPRPSITTKSMQVLGGSDSTPKEDNKIISTAIDSPKNNLVPKGYDQFGRPTGYEELKGLPIETGGKLAMVKQAKKDIQDVRSVLFPDGTAKSFNRGLAIASNLPGSRGHVFSGLIPQALPFHEGGQKVYSRLQNAVAAKLRVETGAQANPSEVENILQRFGISGASSPEAAFDALGRLENFMDETTNIVDPTGKFSGKANNKYSIGQVIPRGGKNYKVVGFDADNEPLVDLVR